MTDRIATVRPNMIEKRHKRVSDASNKTVRPVHGGLNTAELRALGLRPADVLDFSASINPLGASPAAADAILGVDIAAYPDTGCTELSEALAAHHAVPPSHILVGSGSTELIYLAARAYLTPDASAVAFTPTFGEYEAACALEGAHIISIAASEAANFQWDIDAAARTVHKSIRPPSSARLAFLCNPNNPTGHYLPLDDVRRIATTLSADGRDTRSEPPDSLLVLDEAYLPFVENAWDSRELLDLDNVALLRSMTKDYGLTALRLGYLIALPPVIERLRRYQPSWSVNGLAQAAGIAALTDETHVARGRAAVRTAKRYLTQRLDALGLPYTPPAANFVLVKVGDAATLRTALLTRHHIAVRDCASFGLPTHIRIGIRTQPECERLMDAMQQELSSTQ